MALRKSDLRNILKNEDATSEEKISEILNLLHDEVDSIKDERDEISAKLEETEKKLEDTSANSTQSTNEWKDKFNKLNKDFEAYKAEQTEKDTVQAKKSAYRELLKANGVSDKRLDSILKVTDLAGIELENGKIVDADALGEKIKAEWSDFIPTTETHGATTTNISGNDASKKKYTADDIKGMSAAEINKNWGDISASLSSI